MQHAARRIPLRHDEGLFQIEGDAIGDAFYMEGDRIAAYGCAGREEQYQAAAFALNVDVNVI